MKMDVTVDTYWNGEDVKVRGQKVVGKSAYEIGLIVEGQAKLLCPVNYGYLAASITVQAHDHGNEPSAVTPGKQIGPNPGMPDKMKIDRPADPNEVLVGTPVSYGPYVEFGTAKMMAQPFLRPAFHLAMGKALTITKVNAKLVFAEYLYPPGTSFESRGGMI